MALSSQHNDASSTLQPHQPDLPPELVARVADTSDPNVLVIMGAQLSARQQ